MKLLLNILSIAIYILAMKYIGFFISTPVFLFVLASWYAKGYETKTLSRIIFSVLVTVVIFLAYQIAFGYQLPTGIFF